MPQKKPEFYIAVVSLALLAAGFVLFYTVQPFRNFVSDSYHRVFKVAISDRVLEKRSTIQSDIAYCNSSHPHQTLDLYIPNKTDTPRPLVIFVHGGGWWSGDKSSRLLSSLGEDILYHSLAVASVNYRLAPRYTYPSQNDDISCALRFLKDNAERYNLDQSKWGIIGDSAGAQLAAMAIADPEFSSQFKAFVGLYGPYNLEQQINRQPKRDDSAYRYTNSGKDAVAASPQFAPGSTSTKYRLYHGNKDRTVPMSQSSQFADKLRNEGIDIVFTPVENAGHYFSPRTKPASTTIEKEIVKFLRETLSLSHITED